MDRKERELVMKSCELGRAPARGGGVALRMSEGVRSSKGNASYRIDVFLGEIEGVTSFLGVGAKLGQRHILTHRDRRQRRRERERRKERRSFGGPRG